MKKILISTLLFTLFHISNQLLNAAAAAEPAKPCSETKEAGTKKTRKKMDAETEKQITDDLKKLNKFQLQKEFKRMIGGTLENDEAKYTFRIIVIRLLQDFRVSEYFLNVMETTNPIHKSILKEITHVTATLLIDAPTKAEINHHLRIGQLLTAKGLTQQEVSKTVKKAFHHSHHPQADELSLVYSYLETVIANYSNEGLPQDKTIKDFRILHDYERLPLKRLKKTFKGQISLNEQAMQSADNFAQVLQVTLTLIKKFKAYDFITETLEQADAPISLGILKAILHGLHCHLSLTKIGKTLDEVAIEENRIAINLDNYKQIKRMAQTLIQKGFPKNTFYCFALNTSMTMLHLILQSGIKQTNENFIYLKFLNAFDLLSNEEEADFIASTQHSPHPITPAILERSKRWQAELFAQMFFAGKTKEQINASFKAASKAGLYSFDELMAHYKKHTTKEPAAKAQPAPSTFKELVYKHAVAEEQLESSWNELFDLVAPEINKAIKQTQANQQAEYFAIAEEETEEALASLFEDLTLEEQQQDDGGELKDAQTDGNPVDDGATQEARLKRAQERAEQEARVKKAAEEQNKATTQGHQKIAREKKEQRTTALKAQQKEARAAAQQKKRAEQTEKGPQKRDERALKKETQNMIDAFIAEAATQAAAQEKIRREAELFVDDIYATALNNDLEEETKSLSHEPTPREIIASLNPENFRDAIYKIILGEGASRGDLAFINAFDRNEAIQASISKGAAQSFPQRDLRTIYNEPLDNHGNRALHLALLNGKLIFAFLLYKKFPSINPFIRNKKNKSAINILLNHCKEHQNVFTDFTISVNETFQFSRSQLKTMLISHWTKQGFTADVSAAIDLVDAWAKPFIMVHPQTNKKSTATKTYTIFYLLKKFLKE